MPDTPEFVRKKTLQLLYRVCRRHALLPRVLQIPVRYDRTRDALFRGGFADVWKGEHDGREVAVKVLRTYATSDFQKIIGVGCSLCSLFACKPTDSAVQRFCKEVVMWKFLRHPNVLPLVGVAMSETRFARISDWMTNGNIIDFVNARPDVDRHGLVGFSFKVLLPSLH